MKRIIGICTLLIFVLALTSGHTDASALGSGDGMGGFEAALDTVPGFDTNAEYTTTESVEAYNANYGWDGERWVPIQGSAGVEKVITVTQVLPDGSTITVKIIDSCNNRISSKKSGGPGSGSGSKPGANGTDAGNGLVFGGPDGIQGTCDCDGTDDVPKPPPDPTPPNITPPEPKAAIGYARLEAHNYTRGKSAKKGVGMPPSLLADPNNLYDAIDSESSSDDACNAMDANHRICAKPGDEIQIIGEAKAAIIEDWTKSWVAEVQQYVSKERWVETGEKTGHWVKTEEPEREPLSASVLERRRVVEADMGKIFVGKVTVDPVKATLTWSPQTSTYISDYTPKVSQKYCTVEEKQYHQDDCPAGQAPNPGDEKCTFETTISRQIPCTAISGWDPVVSTYISGYTPNYQTVKAELEVEILVPFNYDDDDDDDDDCPAGDPSCTPSPPGIEPCKDLCEEQPTVCTSGDPSAAHDNYVDPCAPEPPEIEPCEILCDEDETWPNYGVAYAGEDLNFNSKIRIKPAYSEMLDQTYATSSKPSTYEIISFVVTPDSNRPGVGGLGAYRSTTPNSGDTCGRYVSGTTLARNCVVLQREEGYIFNPESKLEGDVKAFDTSIVVDDLPVGSKICVAASMWPASSSNGAPLNPYDPMLGANMNAKSGGNWYHGAPYCLTIAKKPNTQFLGAGVYSAGGITTSQSEKFVPYTSGFRASASQNGLTDNDTARRAFGSWVEYEAISNSTIKGFASGAALGYEGVYGHNPFTKPGGFQTNFYANFDTNRLCAYSRSTIANNTGSECQVGTSLGSANISPNNTLLKDRILSRYATVKPKTSTSSITIGSTTPDNDDGSTIAYASEADHVALYSPNQIEKGKTITITVPGKLTIANNIVYHSTTSYDNIADLPQVIIIADSVDIDPGVSQVDAWLIIGENSKKNNDSTGVLNTCNQFSVGSYPSTATGRDGSSSINACDNNTLTINGPVFAKKLLLNRTAGAGSGYSSIDPAETFNLRADAYLWSYSQAQRYSQAVVTYTRELAPRF